MRYKKIKNKGMEDNGERYEKTFPFFNVRKKPENQYQIEKLQKENAKTFSQIHQYLKGSTLSV